MIELNIIDRDGTQQQCPFPEGMNFSLMEALKALEYDVAATCGGMALCATCHIELNNANPNLPEPQELELDMLDTLPDATPTSRLACQIKMSDALHHALIILK